MTAQPDEDEMTELVDADFGRVDLVGKGANGIPRFLIAKQDGDPAGLLEPAFVRDLIAKTNPAPGTGSEEQVTMTGSPAAIAKLIHSAAQDAVTRQPDAVAKDAGPDLDGTTDGMDPMVPLAAPDADAPGDPTDPGSPAWEAIDAATARKWTSLAVRLKNALCVLADRELLEAATTDPDDIDSAWDLQDAMCAVDFVIDTLARFAVGEQAEADLGGEAMAAIGKALAGFDSGPLEIVEGLTGVAKAGRVLSAANETAIRDAAAKLQGVLSSLPTAPTAPDGTGQPVAKAEETDMPVPTTSEDATADSGQKPMGTAAAAPGTGVPVVATTPVAKAAATGDPVGRAVRKAGLPVAVYDHRGAVAGLIDPAAIVERVAKADGDDAKPPMQAVFDQNGDLIGVVDPSAIMPVAGASKPPADPADEPAEAPADPADLTPAPPADAGTPADDVAKAAAGGTEGTITIAQEVLKSTVQDAVSAALEAQGATHREAIAKAAADREEMAEQVEALKGRLETVENSPAASKVFSNGQTPPADQLRGQDQGADRKVAVHKAAELRTQFRNADPGEQNRIAKEMSEAAISHLAVLHGRPQPPA